MGTIHKRQSLKFQVLIWSLSVFFVITGCSGKKPASITTKGNVESPKAAEVKTTSVHQEVSTKPQVATLKSPTADSTISPEVLAVVQKAAKKKDFSKELDEVSKLKNSPVPSLISVFKDPNRAWQERWFAGMALSKFPTDQSQKSLIQGAKDTLSIIRSVSIQALAVFDNETSNKVLQDAINDPSLLVRDTAVKSLGKIKNRDAVEALGKELFNKRNYYRGQPIFGIRENIVQALGDIGSMKGVDPLIKVFQQESNPKMQSLACASLEKIVKPEANAPQKTDTTKCSEYWLTWQKAQNNAVPEAKK